MKSHNMWGSICLILVKFICKFSTVILALFFLTKYLNVNCNRVRFPVKHYQIVTKVEEMTHKLKKNVEVRIWCNTIGIVNVIESNISMYRWMITYIYVLPVSKACSGFDDFCLSSFFFCLKRETYSQQHSTIITDNTSAAVLFISYIFSK